MGLWRRPAGDGVPAALGNQGDRGPLAGAGQAQRGIAEGSHRDRPVAQVEAEGTLEGVVQDGALRLLLALPRTCPSRRRACSCAITAFTSLRSLGSKRIAGEARCQKLRPNIPRRMAVQLGPARGIADHKYVFNASARHADMRRFTVRKSEVRTWGWRDYGRGLPFAGQQRLSFDGFLCVGEACILLDSQYLAAQIAHHPSNGAGALLHTAKTY